MFKSPNTPQWQWVYEIPCSVDRDLLQHNREHHPQPQAATQITHRDTTLCSPPPSLPSADRTRGWRPEIKPGGTCLLSLRPTCTWAPLRSAYRILGIGNIKTGLFSLSGCRQDWIITIIWSFKEIKPIQSLSKWHTWLVMENNDVSIVCGWLQV